MQTSTARGANRGTLLIILAGLSWGTVGVASQTISQLGPTNSVSLSFLRLAVAGPLLLLIGRVTLGRALWPISRRDLGLLMLMGLLSALDYFLYFAAIAAAGVTIATLLTICGAPVLITLVTAVIERRMPSRRVRASVALAVIGTVLLVGGQSSGTQPVSLPGVLISLATACAYAGEIVFGHFLANRHHPLQVTGIAFCTGAVALGLIAGLVGFTGTYPASAWGLIVYIGLVPTALGYALFLIGMRTTSAPVAGVLVLLEPITATLLAWALFGERLSWIGVVGAALLLAVIALLSTRAEQ